MGIKVYTNQGAGPFWSPERGYSRGNFGYLKHIPLTNQWPECIDIMFLVWSNLGTKRFKFVQIKFLGS